MKIDLLQSAETHFSIDILPGEIQFSRQMGDAATDA